MAVRVQRVKRLSRQQTAHTALVTGICRICLVEAMNDGRLRRSEAMLRMVPA